MFTYSPRYTKLSQQVAEAIEKEIAGGTWREELPGERYLAESMQVSRRTVRSAIEILRQKNVLGTVHGLGTKILAPPAPVVRVPPLRNIGLLLPEDIDHLRPQTMVFIDSLRSLLYANGLRLDTHISQRFFSSRPAAALKKLVTQFPHDAWILAFSTRENQMWFQSQGLPALVVGTPHSEVRLPYVDIDMMAMCRHAAGLLLRKGHRHIGLLIEKSGKAGDHETEAGFLEGVKKYGGVEARASVFRHTGAVTSIRQQIQRVLLDPARPTALFISNPYHYLAAASILAERGVHVPRDMSLLCRDDDLFLSFLSTEPSRYICSAQTRAKVAIAILMRILESSTDEGASHVRLMPKFQSGASVAGLLL